MMNKNLFSDGLGHIDPDAVERMLRMEDDLARKAARRRYAWVKPVLIAAALALMLSAVLVIVPFIPKKLDIEYEPVYGPDQSVWVYYTTENGTQKRERVSLPGGAGNVFEAWKYLNAVDSAVEILGYEEVTDQEAGATVVPNTLWEYMKQEFFPASGQKTVTVTLSAQITSCDNYDALIESLQKTLAKYAGVDAEQIRILIDGEQTVVIGGLEFWHSLQGGGPVVGVLGSTFEITVGMTNRTLKDIEFTGSWMAFVPNAILTMNDTNVILHEDYPMTEEYQKYTLAPGESREMTYTFLIPEQAACGEYDLVVSFGEHSFTFEKAVQIVGFGYVPSLSVSATEFHEFLLKYGFNTTDPEAFKQAVGMQTYLSGQSVLDIMNPWSPEYAPGYSGEEYGSNLFAYGYTCHPDGSCNNYFGGLALPGDMRLPHGITPGDRLVDSLHKMGVDPDTAQDTVERAKKLFEGEQIRLGDNFNTFCITRNRHGEYIIHYDFIAAPVDGDPAPPEYSLELIYSEANMTFVCFYVKAGYGDFSVEMFSSPIFVSSMWSSALGKELDADETRQLLDIIDSTTRQDGKPDVPCDYYIVFDGFLFSYNTETGILMGQERYYEFSDEQRLIINEIVANSTYAPNFQSVTLKDSGILTPSLAQKLLSLMNNGTWHDGCLAAVPEIEFDCDGIMVGYTHGSLFTTEHYMFVGGFDLYQLDSLWEAVGSVRLDEYDFVVYFMGEYYGHSTAVDEKYAGSATFVPDVLDESIGNTNSNTAWLALYQPELADSHGMQDVRFDVQDGFLVAENGMFFEQFTDFDPNFGRGDVYITCIEGEECNIRISTADARILRDALINVEAWDCPFASYYLFDTVIKVGGYTLGFDFSFNGIRLGNRETSFATQEDYEAVEAMIQKYTTTHID